MTVLEKVVESSQQKRPRTKAAYLHAVRAFVAHAGTSPKRWTGGVVEEWRDAMLAAGLSPQSVNARLAALRFAAKRYEELGYGVNFARPAEFVQYMKEQKRKARPRAEVQRLFDVCYGSAAPRDVRDYALLTLGFRTGLRREGLTRLTWEDIAGRIATVIIKGGRRYEVGLDDDTIEALTAWRTVLHAAGINSGAVFRSISRTGRIGTGIHPTSINDILRRRSRQAGIVHLYPHLMRHCFVSWALADGVPPARIQKTTGHRRADMINLYTTDLEAGTDPVGNHMASLKPERP